VKIVDTIGGVDFNIDSPSYSREHIKGMQHMSGEDVLFYVRVRKVWTGAGRFEPYKPPERIDGCNLHTAEGKRENCPWCRI